MLLHKDDSAQLDRAAAKVVAKFDKLNFSEPLLKVSECDTMALCVLCMTTLSSVLCKIFHSLFHDHILLIHKLKWVKVCSRI